MFGIDSSELLLVAFVALVVIGPKDLPKAMRVVGYWVGRARGVARQFRSGFDSMVREAELEEMEKRWAEENARILREHPATTDPATADPAATDPATADPATADPATADPATADPAPADAATTDPDAPYGPTDDVPPAETTPAPVIVDAPEVAPAPDDHPRARTGEAAS